jgi:adenylate kinase
MERMLDRAKKENRIDDTIDVIENRLKEYRNKTVPVVDFYKDKGICYSVDGVGSIDEIFERITNVVEQSLTKTWLNVVLFGPPGSGKGTQGKMVADKYDLVYISTGSLLRKEIEKGSDIGITAKEYMERGEIVPDEYAIKLIEKQIQTHPDAKGFFFKGYPRTIVQAYILDGLLRKLGSSVSCVFNLDVPTLESIKRLTAQSKTDQRRYYDMDTDVIIRRLENFQNRTIPVLNYYEKQKNIYKINGIGSEEDVYKRLVENLELAFKHAR